jgi:serine/threonine protein kinase
MKKLPAASRIKELFGEAAAMEPTVRAEFLARACGTDDALRAELVALLDAHDRSAGRLEGPAQSVTDAPPIDEKPGSRIGAYKLLELIGEGGFGSVFMAEQEHPIRRRVAIKVLKLGMDSRQVVARFEAERQALALMDHPNIARVLDAGATSAGRPYFVMELVRGVPITQFCDQANLSTAERLAVFVPVCHAIHHAHQKGIIHRDLKPTNVLVTLHDGKPVPKVIDFGIAKAVEGRLTDKTLFTGFGQLIGTPAYMSPEQAEMSGLDIDTRSDVYSLGVLLYELLAGAPPFDPQHLRDAGMAEVLRIIREVEPPKPSTRVSTLGDVLPSVAARRATEPRKLGALLRGDLDWVVMKALAKERRRRYDSASALAFDVERYIAHEPVLAGPPGYAYRWSKFVRRNRTVVVAGAIVVLALVGGLAASTIAFVKERAAQREALASAIDAGRKYAIAREGADLLLNEVVRELPKVTGTRELQRQILDAALAHYEKLAAEKPGDFSEQRLVWIAFQELGDAYSALGEKGQAEAAYKRFQDLVVPALAANPSNRDFRNDRAVSYERDGTSALDEGRVDAASAAFEAEREILEKLSAEAPDDRFTMRELSTCFGLLAMLAKLTGDESAAGEWNAKALVLLEKASATTPKNAATLTHLAFTLERIAQSSKDPRREIERAYRIANEAAALEGDTPRNLAFRASLDVQHAMHDMDDTHFVEMRAHSQSAIEVFERLAASEPKNPDYQLELLDAYESAAVCAFLTGRLDESRELSAKAFACASRLDDSRADSVEFLFGLARTTESLADLSERSGDVSSARRPLERASALYARLAKLFPENREQILGSLRTNMRLAPLVDQTGEFERASKYLEEADHLSQRALELYPGDYRTLLLRQATLLALTDHAVVVGDFAAASVSCRDALTRAEDLLKEHPANIACEEALYLALDRKSDIEFRRVHMHEASEPRRRALEVRERILAADPENAISRFTYASCIIRLANILDILGEHSEARTRFVQGREILRDLVKAEPDNTRMGAQAAYAMLRVGQMCEADGDLDGAIEQYTLMYETLVPIVARQPQVVMNRSSMMDGCERLANAYWQKHDEQKTREWTKQLLAGRRALADAPAADSETLNSCAWSLLSCEPEDMRDPQKALEYARQAVALTKNNDAPTLDTCALALFECGEFARAVETQEHAMAILGSEDRARQARYQARLDQYRARGK